MKKGMTKAAQQGFTLIELIVVIVILGILAATALPKFGSISGDARVASLSAARGSIKAAAAMAHAKFVLDPNTTTIDGVAVAFKNGYPDAASIGELAGLKGEYTLINKAGTKPTSTANDLVVLPKGVKEASDLSATCYLMYSQADTATPTAEPVIGDVPTADNCK